MKFVIEPYKESVHHIYRDDRFYVIKWRFDFLPFWFAVRENLIGSIRYFHTYEEAEAGIVEFQSYLEDVAKGLAEDTNLEDMPWLI